MLLRHLPRLLLCLLILGASLSRAEPDMSAAQAYAALSAGKIMLIDIRTPQEWRQTGVAPGTGRVDFYSGPAVLLQSVLQMVGGDNTAPVALICRTGNRTTHAQQFLRAQGFTQVYNVKEGMAGSAAGSGWLRRGLPVESCAQC
jgi:rhodanese-related sulfurtransferase